MCSACRRRIDGDIRLVQALGRVLADRLEHPIARADAGVTAAQQALVEQRLECVGVGAGNILGSLEGTPSREDAERSEHALLAVVEQLMRPVDRRPQRLLPRVGVTAALEEIESLPDPLEKLLRREDDRSRGCQLERQRQVVEPGAEILHNRPVGGVGAQRV